MPANDARNVSPAAERMRLSRQRRRDGLRCLLIELRETEIGELVRRGICPAMIEMTLPRSGRRYIGSLIAG